jgi:hypothetical protein
MALELFEAEQLGTQQFNITGITWRMPSPC